MSKKTQNAKITGRPLCQIKCRLLHLSYDANTTTEERTATITFTTSYNKTQTLTITQAAFVPTLSLSKSSESILCTDGSFDLDVTSNVDWSTSGVPEWATIDPTNGSGDQSVTLSYDANTTTEERTATITFTTSYNTTQTFTITQAAFVPTLTLSKSSESVSVDFGSITISITSNTSWSTSGVPEWATINPTNGSGDQSVTLSYDANTTTDERTATITFTTSYNTTQTLTITQAAFVPTLSINKSSESVNVDSGSITISITSNTSWTTSGVPEWATIDPANGSGNQSVTLSYEANTTTEERTAIITFTTSYNTTQTFTITQATTPQLDGFNDGGSI